MKTSNVNFTTLGQFDQNFPQTHDASLSTSHQITSPNTTQSRLTPAQQNKLHPMQMALVNQLQKEIESKACNTPSENKDDGAPVKFNLQRIASNAFLSGMSIGPTFGTATAINNYLRDKTVCPSLKVFVGFGPMVAGVVSSVAAEGIRNIFDIQSTNLEKESLLRDAATPASFISISSAYGYWANGKGFKGLRASLGTMAIATLGSSIGGALAEAVGQSLPKSTENILPTSHQNPTALQVGVGRSITQIPSVVFNKINTAHFIGTGSLPGFLSKPTLAAAAAYPLVVGIPFIGRKYVTPSTPLDTELASSNKE